MLEILSTMESRLRAKDMILNVDIDKILACFRSNNENKETKKLVILYGTPGIGKTSNAIECAYKLINDEQWVVHWFDTDSKEKLSNGLRKLYESYNNSQKSCSVDDNSSNITFDFLIAYFKTKFNSLKLKKKFLLIFDNLIEIVDEEEEWLNYAIAELLMPENVHILITCRNSHVLDAFNLDLLKFEVNYLSQHQAREYFYKNLKRKATSYSEQETEALLEKYFFKHTQILPYDLNLLVSVLNENDMWEVSDLDELSEDEQLAERIFKRLYEQSISKKSPIAWLALEYMCLLDLDQIPVSLLMKLLDSFDRRLFQLEVLNVLKRNSLILDISKIDGKQICLRIHRRTQDLIKKCLGVSSQKENIEKRLIKILSDEFPRVSMKPSEEWKRAKLLINHVLCMSESEFLRNDKECFLRLNEKIAYFYFYCLGDYGKSLAHFTKDKEIRENSMHSNEDLAKSYSNLGSMYSYFGSYEQAKEYHMRALDIYEKIYANTKFHPEFATIYNNLGWIYSKLGSYGQAKKFQLKAKNFREEFSSSSSKNDPTLAWIYTHLGLTFSYLGSYNQAKEFHAKALSIREEIHRENRMHPDLAKIYASLGWTQSFLGFYAQAKDYHMKALNIYEEIYKCDKIHPELGKIYNNLGSSFSLLGVYDKAKEYHIKALDIFEEIHKNKQDHPHLAWVYHQLGKTLTEMGFYDAAKEYLSKAMSIREKIYKSTSKHPELASIYFSLGEIFFYLKLFANAKDYYHKALEILEEIHQEESRTHPHLGFCYNGLGKVYSQLNLHAQSFEYHKKSIHLNELRHPQKDHIDLAKSYGFAAQSYFNKGDEDYTEALSFILISIQIIESLYVENKEFVVPVLGEFYYLASEIYFSIKSMDTSLGFALKSLTIREFLFLNKNNNHPDLKKTYGHLCQIYRQINNESLALEYEMKKLKND
jgi:tetratricopeptide (TPR) repeat protein